MPRVLTIMQKCVEHKIQDAFIKNLHFNDLYCLIMSLDISNLRQLIKQQNKLKNKNRNVTIKDISQADAVKFLKGGQ